MKKKILFVLPSFEIGGTTVSTRNLISLLDKEKYDITVWGLNEYGILKWMYDGLPCVKTCFATQALALSGWKKETNITRKLLAAIIRKIAYNNNIKKRIINYSIKRCIGKKHFDTVISCQEGFATLFASHIISNNHLAWVRCDYKEYFKGHNLVKESFYNNYNHIVCVAEKTKDNFIEIYPEHKKKTICIYNPQDSNLIIDQSNIDDHDERFKFNIDKKVIVSLGRLNRVKRFDRIPSIARKLLNNGLNFVWYVVGDGEEKTVIANAIKQHRVENNVIMLGAKSNPHFYIKRADLYVCLSSSEACPRVVNEAKILSTPVVSTNFPTIYEYIEDGINGRIVSIEEIPQAILEIFNNKEQYSNIKKEISKFTFDNTCLIKDIENII